MGAVGLARINRILRQSHIDGDQPGDTRRSVIAGSKQCQLMATDGKGVLTIDLVLAAMLGQVEEAIAACDLESEPCTDVWILRTPASHQIKVAAVPGEFCERFQAWSKSIGYRKVHGVVAVTYVECSRVGLNAADESGDQEIGVGIAIAVGIGGEIVGQQE